jgi:hypothetical protein
MENVVTNFESPEISIKLTDEKLYIKTRTSNETFALRSVNGVGIVDLIEKYNQELKLYNNQKSNPLMISILGGAFICIGLISIVSSIGMTIFFFIIGIILFIISSNSNLIAPNLKSAVRIMISGINRDFEFDKSGSHSSKIAELVIKVEETLTAYHKNNK